MSNREIKFRVWDKLQKRFCPINIDCYTIKWQGDVWLISCSKLYDDSCFPYARLDSERFCVLQYTNLKDRSGKEIYEGDILLLTDENSLNYDINKKVEVKWNYCEYECFWLNSAEEFEIIGNVYENPELLKK